MAILSIWTGFGPKVANSNEKAPKVLERFWFPDLGLDPLGGSIRGRRAWVSAA